MSVKATEHTSLLVSPHPPPRFDRTASNEGCGSDNEGETDQIAASPELSLERGSVLSSVVNLCTATLGAGCLSLPWALAQSGLITGLVLILGAAWASNFTIRLLVRLYATGEHTSFESLAMRAFGPIGSIITHFAVLIFCFGAAVASVMVVGDILEPVFRLLLPNVHALHHKALISVLLTVCIMLPLSFFTRISSLRVMSLVSTSGVLALACVFIIEGITAAVHGKIHMGAIELFKFDANLLLALPVFMFAYSCQTNIFTILEEQTDQRRETDFRMVNLSIGVETTVYLTIGVLGYLLYGSSVDGNVLRNFDLSNPLHVFAQACIGLSLCLSYPLCTLPARFTIQDMLWHGTSSSAGSEGEEEEQESALSPRSILLTLVLVFSSLAFAIMVPSISELFTLLGSTTGALIAFILPCSMYLRLGSHEEKQQMRRRICKIMLVVASIVAVATTTRSLMFIAETKSHDLRREPTHEKDGLKH